MRWKILRSDNMPGFKSLKRYAELLEKVKAKYPDEFPEELKAKLRSTENLDEKIKILEKE